MQFERKRIWDYFLIYTSFATFICSFFPHIGKDICLVCKYSTGIVCFFFFAKDLVFLAFFLKSSSTLQINKVLSTIFAGLCSGITGYIITLIIIASYMAFEAQKLPLRIQISYSHYLNVKVSFCADSKSSYLGTM